MSPRQGTPTGRFGGGPTLSHPMCYGSPHVTTTPEVEACHGHWCGCCEAQAS